MRHLLSAFALLVSLNIAAATWTETGPMVRPRAAPAAMLLPDGRVLIVGGRDASGIINIVEAYQPQTNTFTKLGSLATSEPQYHLVLQDDGTVLIAGASGSIEVFNPASNSFAQRPSLKRSIAFAAPFDDGVLLCQGCAACFLYRDGTVQDGPPIGSATLPQDATEPVVLPGGSVVVAAGRVCSVYGPYATAQVLLFAPDLLGVRSTTGNDCYAGRAWHTSTAVGAHHVLMAGGLLTGHHYCLQGKVLNTTSIYDAQTGVTKDGPVMLTPRQRQVAAPLRDGTVMTAGGSSTWQNIALRSAELLNAQRTKFEPLPDMPSTRTDGKAVALRDGRVLVAGGSGGSLNDMRETGLIFDSEKSTTRPRTVGH